MKARLVKEEVHFGFVVDSQARFYHGASFPFFQALYKDFSFHPEVVIRRTLEYKRCVLEMYQNEVPYGTLSQLKPYIPPALSEHALQLLVAIGTALLEKLQPPANPPVILKHTRASSKGDILFGYYNHERQVSHYIKRGSTQERSVVLIQGQRLVLGASHYGNVCHDLAPLCQALSAELNLPENVAFNLFFSNPVKARLTPALIERYPLTTSWLTAQLL